MAFGRFGWLFALWLVVGLGAALSSSQEIRLGWTFNHQSVKVTGQIDYLAVGASPCTKGEGGGCPKTIVRYHFDTPSGLIRGEARLGRNVWPDLRHGGPIVLRYLPHDPAQQEVDFGSTLRHGVSGLAMSALFILFGSSFGSYVWWANHMIRLRNRGTVRQAQISPTGPERDPLLKWWFIRWTDEAGVQGKSQWYWGADRLPPAGAAIRVFVDPSGRAPSVWEGDCGS